MILFDEKLVKLFAFYCFANRKQGWRSWTYIKSVNEFKKKSYFVFLQASRILFLKTLIAVNLTLIYWHPKFSNDRLSGNGGFF
jgi:hypothetical protein